MSVAVLGTISPTLGKQFGMLINVSTVWVIIPYILCAAALWRLAAPLAGAAKAATRAAVILALGFNLWLLTTSDRPTAWATGILAVVVIALWLGVARRAGGEHAT